MGDYKRNLNADQVLQGAYDEVERALRITGESLGILSRRFTYAQNMITIENFIDSDHTTVHSTITITLDNLGRATEVRTRIQD